jgi:hypothetical protein
MAEVRNYTMNFGSGVTLASQALASAATSRARACCGSGVTLASQALASATTSGRRRALWPALVYLLRTEIHG